MSPDKFHFFKSDISKVELPRRFNFPFYYEPHTLSKIAASELQTYLENQNDFVHDFGNGSDPNGKGIGKMFGILVVQNQERELGYLCAYSGKLAESNDHQHFVPPVYDMLAKNSYFKAEEEVLNALNRSIEGLENDEQLLTLKDRLESLEEQRSNQISKEKQRVKEGKKARKKIRTEAVEKLSDLDYEDLKEKLKNESLKQNYQLRDLVRYWDHKIEQINAEFEPFKSEIEVLKKERKEKSAALQKWLFEQYQFLNIKGDRADLLSIFQGQFGITPPAGAGECAAPKLFQYAFLHHLQPICLAEFWWGKSSAQEVRKQGLFYPSCRGKCEPILGHMLKGLDMDSNPMLVNPAKGKLIKYIYEDEHLVVIDKPAEFLSVPGKVIQDSVYERVKSKYSNATGPLIVHRLDMSTSGLMLIAKTKDVHKALQGQFIRRKIKKRYVALLSGVVEGNSGEINLPLRVDLDNRPSQMVCYDYGKKALTRWEIEAIEGEMTRVNLYPITGRTHQLRVHAAHPLGLNCPIVGDDLYGLKGERLHLHAEEITFCHPVTKEINTILSKAPF